jgi:hypothetical protein
MDRASNRNFGLIGVKEQATAPTDKATNAHSCFMAALLCSFSLSPRQNSAAW